jgi:sulfoxide reductase catalytic subunit YedY
MFLNRRELLAGAAATGAIALLTKARAAEPAAPAGKPLPHTRNAKYSVTETPNKYAEITGYNNYYEFGTDKEDPQQNARTFKPEPWTVTVDGEAEQKGKFTLEDILKPQALEERIYRFRCVEAWSMVIPWVGFQLSALLERFKPTSRAKYVEFTTLYDPSRMPGQRAPILNWPYVEGLRIDEAMHPLALMVVGLYGQTLPNQDGAPLRLIVPWKYGFKSIKAITRINFTERQPRTAWNVAAPQEYGFYANVNPQVDHPRWSQASERHIGGGFLAQRRPTLMFNGYADLVADLYKGMDLRRYY